MSNLPENPYDPPESTLDSGEIATEKVALALKLALVVLGAFVGLWISLACPHWLSSAVNRFRFSQLSTYSFAALVLAAPLVFATVSTLSAKRFRTQGMPLRSLATLGFAVGSAVAFIFVIRGGSGYNFANPF